AAVNRGQDNDGLLRHLSLPLVPLSAQKMKIVLPAMVQRRCHKTPRPGCARSIVMPFTPRGAEIVTPVAGAAQRV
ncbi:MAG: hypothetical protein ACU85V_12890, partial [Gammaproteobacteria bacterium]